MKNLSILTFILMIFVCSCVQAPESDDAQVEAPKKVPQKVEKTNDDAGGSFTSEIALDKSRITWIGTKPTGRHTGTLNLKKGSLSSKGNTITGGEFVIDMSTLKVMDMDEENNNNLANHLKSDEFFKVEKFPEGKFVLTSVVPYQKKEGDKTMLAGASHTVTGNLTLLETTNSVSFPAKISIGKSGAVKASANFNIDRTDWGITYGNDKSLGDKFIKPDVNIALNLKTK